MSHAIHRALAVPAATVLAVGALFSVAATPTRAAEHTVEIGDGFFGPSGLTIAPGDTVTWVNVDDSPHTVTADDGAFDSGNLEPGQSWSVTFDQAATIAYHCNYHDEMRASLTVAAAAPAEPAEPAGPAGPAAQPEQPQATPGTSAHHAPGSASGTDQQPDTALEAPGARADAPVLLMGFGLLLIGLSLMRRGPSPAAASARPVGGWRR